MKKFLLLFLSLIFVFSVSGCGQKKKNTLTEDDILKVINDNHLNSISYESTGYSGKDIELDVEKIEIEKSNIRGKDASCDAKVTLSSDYVRAEIFFRFDLKMEKKSWKLSTVKNYKKYTLDPIRGVNDDDVLAEISNNYPDDYSFTVDSNDYDLDKDICSVVISYTGGSDFNKVSGKLTATYIFDTDKVKWVLDRVEEDAFDIDSWNPEGQWRFTDNKYYYRIEIFYTDDTEENAIISAIASEHASIADTADFQQETEVAVTQSGTTLYFEPFELVVNAEEEEKTNLMLCLKEDGLYFSTNETDGYEKANLPREAPSY